MIAGADFVFEWRDGGLYVGNAFWWLLLVLVVMVWWAKDEST